MPWIKQPPSEPGWYWWMINLVNYTKEPVWWNGSEFKTRDDARRVNSEGE